MMNKRILLSILLLFLILFILFMFSALSAGVLTEPEINTRDGAAGTAGVSVLQEDAFAVTDGDMETDDPQRSQAEASTAGNPTAVLLTTDEGELAVFKEWCVYGKYRYRAYTAWPDAAALDGADVVLVGRMPYGAASLATLTAYAQTGITLLFTRLPAYDLLAGDPALADFFGITQCMEPARRVDGLKLFANFFLSKERIYTAGDFYGDLDDTRFTLPYYTLRTGYEGYMVGMLDDQKELGIENEELPTLLWRTRTGRSQICVVNTDLFDGERMLGVLTAFVSATSDWHLYPVVNARTILMTDFPFLSNENTAAMRKRYSRDTLGFQRDIVWPNVVKVLRNYEAVPNFFLSPQLDYTDGVEPVTDDLAMYLRQIQGLSGTVGLSLLQTSGLSLSEVVDKAAAYFEDALPDYRFYAAFGGNFTDDAWQAYLSGDRDALLSDLSLLLFPYREGRALFTLPDGQVLSALMTTDGFTHETLDDLQLLSLMTAVGYSAQQVDMARALLPAGDEDDWSNLSVLWSRGDTYYRDFAAFANASVYEMEARVRRLLSANYTASRDGDTLRIAISGFDGELWFVLRLHGETVSGVTGGEATALSDTAWLVRLDTADAVIALAPLHRLDPPATTQGGTP